MVSMTLLLCGLYGCEEDTEPMIYPPTLITNQTQEISRFEATLTGTAIKNAASIVDCEVGFLISESSKLTLEDAVEAVESTESKNLYNCKMKELTSGKTYYYCIYAKSGSTMAKGSVMEFTTLSSVAPVLTTTVAVNPNEYGVSLSSELTDDGGEVVTERGFCFKVYTSDSDLPTAYDKKVKVAKEDEAFVIDATNLKPSTRYIVRAYALNRRGTGYAESTTFTTEEEKLPKLTCNSVENLQATNAQVSANITNSFGFDITEKGFCYSVENPTPTIENLKELVVPSATFALQLNALSENTTYYLRAYAISEKGTGYSNVIEFQTKQLQRAELSQPVVSNITFTSASVTATRTMPAGTQIISGGFCYSKLSTRPGVDGAHTSNSSTSNTLSEVLTLEEGTRYYVTAYTTTPDGTFYSEAVQLSTNQTKTPTITIAEATEIGEYGATIEASISDNGGDNVTERGICWSDALNAPTIDNSKLVDSSTGNTFTLKMAELTAGNKYYVRAFAKNKNGIAYSRTMEFTTMLTYKPTVEALSFSNIYETSAQVTASVSSDGGTSITEQGVCYSMNTLTPTIDDTKVEATLDGSTLKATLTGLTKGTTYHVRAYAKNKNGITYSAVRDLTTVANTIPQIFGLHTTLVADDNVALQATISSNGGLPITERGFIYSLTVANPKIDDAGVTILKSNDTENSFTAKMKGLTYTTLYYVQAYAKNELGIAYSEAPIYFRTSITYTPTPNSPTVDYEQITTREAVVSGSIANDGGAEVTETGFWYSTQNEYTATESNGTLVKSTATGDNNVFSAKLENLAPYTYYYVRCYARNKNGIAFSSSYTSFTTQQSVPDENDNILPEI